MPDWRTRKYLMKAGAVDVNREKICRLLRHEKKVMEAIKRLFLSQHHKMGEWKLISQR